MVRVETTDLERKAAQLSAQLPVPPGLPLPADGLKIASDGLSLLAASAQKFAAAISNGQAQASRLSQSFTSAAATYRTVDQNVSGVLNNDGAASTLAPVLAAAPSASPSAPADVAPGTRPSATFTKVEDAARQLLESDQGASLATYASGLQAYAAQLEERAGVFTSSGVEWESPAASRAFDDLSKYREWLQRMAEVARKIAEQAERLGRSHNKAATAHPTLQEVLDVLNKIITDPDNREYWIEMYRLLQQLCEQILEEYANECDVEDVDTPEAPSGSGGDGGGGGGEQPTGDEQKQEDAAAQQQEPTSENPAASPSGESGAGSGESGSGSGSGSPSGGSGSSGGSGTGSGLPSLPTGDEAGKGLPTLPDDASVKPAAAELGGGGGGAGGGSGGGGGGVGPMPLQPSVGGVAVTPSPAGGAVPAAAAGAASAGGGMAGGMGGGMAPMHGAQGQGGGKDRQRTPGLSPDEELYTEDRPWTEAVVGMPQGRRAGDGKGGK